MTARNGIGIGIIAAVLAIAGWFIAVSPGQQAAIRVALRDRPSVIMCAWSQPWADPAYVLTGWSQPQAWWHQPDIKVLWSNSREAQILFRLPPGLSDNDDVEIAIKYVAVSAPTQVIIDGQHAGDLVRNADGNQAARILRHRLSSLPSDRILDVHFIVRDAILHKNDGRYLGVLLNAMELCGTKNIRAT